MCIGWNEAGVIGTFLGAIATFSAVVVALCANGQAKKQLKSALEMQEQSKNVELMDKRIALAESIQKGHEVSEMSLKILFDDEIVNCYLKWRLCVGEVNDATSDEDQFLMLTGGKPVESISNKQGKTVRLSEIRTHIKDVTAKANDEKTQLLQLIEKYISKSIQPLNKE